MLRRVKQENMHFLPDTSNQLKTQKHPASLSAKLISVLAI